MDIVIHRINTIKALESVDPAFGVEVDIRADGRDLILNHNPFEGGELLVDYLERYQHGLLVLNIKEAGIEDEVVRLVRKRGVERFFLLDVEFPYIYRAARAGQRAIAMRYSEDESIETVLKYSGLVDWVWVDTNTRLPLDGKTVESLKLFKTCLVCPERWGRPQDIGPYQTRMKSLGFTPDAVMTGLGNVAAWERYFLPTDNHQSRRDKKDSC